MSGKLKIIRTPSGITKNTSTAQCLQPAAASVTAIHGSDAYARDGEAHVRSLPAPGARIGRRQIGSAARSTLPVYHQLHLILGQRIRDRTYAPGSLLPAEFDLAAQYGVSRVSVRRTLALLERDGLILRRRGVGTFVRGDEAAAPSGTEITDSLNTIGLDTEARTLSFGEEASAPAYVAVALALPEDVRPFCLRRLRLHRGTPFSLSAIWLPPEKAALIDLASLKSGTTVAALELAGVRSASAEQTISATLADHEASALLEVPMGSALVVVRRTVRGADKQPLLLQHSLYRPDKYEYHMALARDQNAGRPRWRHVG
jgi:GntR family transcriptional regulator